MSTTPALRAVNLSHTYPATGTDTAPEPALVEVSAEVPNGSVVAVLGPSGCGKSTLLTLFGLLGNGRGTTGELSFHDGNEPYDLLDLRSDEQAALRADAFGFVLQSNYLLPSFTCLENVGMPLAMHGWPTKARARWAEKLVEAAGDAKLTEKMHDRPRHVSAGQRQRFAVLRALVTDPMVVFADEPSSNLDGGNTKAMFELFDRWRSGDLFTAARAEFAADRRTPSVVEQWLKAREFRTPPRSRTLIVVSHDVGTAYQWANHFLLIDANHRQAGAFTKAQWRENAKRIDGTLGLLSGTAARLTDAAGARE